MCNMCNMCNMCMCNMYMCMLYIYIYTEVSKNRATRKNPSHMTMTLYWNPS